MEDAVDSELQNLFSQFNHQNFQQFQSFEQSYQDWTTRTTPDSEVAIINTIIETSQSLQQNFLLISAEISNFAEKVSGLVQLSEKWREEYVSVLEGQYTIFQNFQQVWNLLEIFQINTFSKFTIFDLLPSLQMTRFSAPDYYQAFLSMTHPERYDPSLAGSEEMTDESGLIIDLPFSYWDVVYDSILQGNLTTALEFLKLHSEVRDYFNLASSSSSLRPLSRVRRLVSKEEVQRLFQLIESYPYRECLQLLFPTSLREILRHTAAEETSFSSYYERELYFLNYFQQQHPSLAMELSKWQESLEHFRESSHLLTQIPELDFLLRIMQGEIQAIELQAKGHWHLHLLARFLYQFPCHQLTKMNIRRMMVEVLDHYFPPENIVTKATSLLVTSPEILGDIYREILKGNVGGLMKVLYETSAVLISNMSLTPGLSNSSFSSFSLSILLSLVHLCRLLIIGGNVVELSTPLANSLHQVSFLEEVILEASEKLSQLHYSPEILKGYLSLSPQYGSLFYRQLLLHRPITSDEDCAMIASALVEAGFIEDSLRVYSMRGRYWLNHRDNYRNLREDVATNAALYGWKSAESSTLAKAAYHYLQAKDDMTVALMLESSLYRCMAAVVDCSDIYFLDMLHFYPGKPILPQRPGQLDISSSSSTSSGKGRSSADQIITHNSSIMAVDDTVDPQETTSPEAVEERNQSRMNYLDYALREAEDLLQSIDLSTLTSLTSLNIQYSTLQSYVSAVTALLLPKSTPENASYREAAQSIARLLVPNPESVQSPSISSRYWMHLLELAYLVHHMITSLELKQSLDLNFLAQFDPVSLSDGRKAPTAVSGNTTCTPTHFSTIQATLDQTMMTIDESPRPSGETIGVRNNDDNNSKAFPATAMTHFGQPVYSKAIVNQFHVIYLLLEQLPDFPFLCLLSSRRARGNDRTDSESDSEERDLRDQLKMNLLSLLTSTYLVSSHAYFSHLSSQPTASDMEDLVFSRHQQASFQSKEKRQADAENNINMEDQCSTWQLQQILPTEKSGDNVALMTMDYDVEDLLDGSVFFASL